MASIKANQTGLLRFIKITQARAWLAHHAKFRYKHCKFQLNKAFVSDRYYLYASLQAQLKESAHWCRQLGGCRQLHPPSLRIWRGLFFFWVVFVFVAVFVAVLGLFVAVVLERFFLVWFLFICLFLRVFWLWVGFYLVGFVVFTKFPPHLYFDLLQVAEKSVRGRETSSAREGRGRERRGNRVDIQESPPTRSKSSITTNRKSKTAGDWNDYVVPNWTQKETRTAVKVGTRYAEGVQSCCDSTRKARARLELNLATFLHMKGNKSEFYV